MKIVRALTKVLRVPERTLVANVSAGPPMRDFVTLELETDEGVVGIGITFFGGPLIAALQAAVDALAASTIGEDPLRVEAIVAKLRRATGFAGPGGIFTLALAAIDIALWDIKGKAFHLPVVSHLFPEIHVHLVAGIPNGLMVEYMPWTLGLFEEVPIIERGLLQAPQRAGLGLTFDATAIRKWQIG